MTLDVLAGTRTAAEPVSEALAELVGTVARSVVLVRGWRGSSGSGVIWDQPGLVITNAHVVPEQAAELTMWDGWRMAAQVVRRAPTLDLAALRVDGELPHPALIGDSDRLRVGDLLLAIGNPMGERNAPSLGILASAARDVLRLSLTLRPGNSGGALVNARGEVVGIPHMVTGNGLALAVSTSTVRRFLAGAGAGEEEEQEQEQDSLRWV